MWLMLQQDEPDDYVIGTGRDARCATSARLAFERVGLDYREYVVQDARFIRPGGGGSAGRPIPPRPASSSAGRPASRSRSWCR